MSRLLLFILILIAQIFFYSCKTGMGKGDPDFTNQQDTISVLPKISASQLQHYQDGIQKFYKQYLSRSGFNGGILVAKNGQIVYEKYVGYYDLSNKKDTLDQHSAFHLASVSKTFTGMATLRLVEEGKLDLNDTLTKFFPDFPYPGVTIKMLLSHRSGLPNYLYFMEEYGWPRKEYCSNQDILDYMIKYKPARTSFPDTRFQYCNTNFSLLGLIINKVSGMSYADYLRKEFFVPLGMNDTYVFDPQTDDQRAMPSFDYRGSKEGLTFLDMGYGDKNIYSTPRDLLKWDQALYGNTLFSEKTLEMAFTPYSNEKPGIRNYGLGWRMNIYPDSTKIIYHNGWWHGNNTVFIRDIPDSATIIVLGNRFDKNIYQAKKIMEIFDPIHNIARTE